MVLIRKHPCPDWYAPTVLIQAATTTSALGEKKKRQAGTELLHRDADEKPTAYSMIQLLGGAPGKQDGAALQAKEDLQLWKCPHVNQPNLYFTAARGGLFISMPPYSMRSQRVIVFDTKSLICGKGVRVHRYWCKTEKHSHHGVCVPDFILFSIAERSVGSCWGETGKNIFHSKQTSQK